MLVRTAIAAVASLGALACGGDDGPAMRPMVCPMAGAAAAAPWRPHSQCGPTADFTPINRYHGELATAQDREDAVALLRGTCTGTLIAAAAGPVILTAGHCVADGEQLIVAFNVEADPDGDTLFTNGTVFERADQPDYALLRLDQLPSVVPTQLTTQTTERLAIIQHPRGGSKVIAVGDLAGECDDVIYYSDLDTEVGSSGAGVLNLQGYLVGVHSDGDCSVNGGTNHGSTADAIVRASAYLQDTDIADR